MCVCTPCFLFRLQSEPFSQPIPPLVLLLAPLSFTLDPYRLSVIPLTSVFAAPFFSLCEWCHKLGQDRKLMGRAHISATEVHGKIVPSRQLFFSYFEGQLFVYVYSFFVHWLNGVRCEEIVLRKRIHLIVYRGIGSITSLDAWSILQSRRRRRCSRISSSC